MDHVYQVTVIGSGTNSADRVVRYFALQDDAHDFADNRRGTSVIVTVKRLRVR